VSDGVFKNIITTLSEEDFTPDDIKYCYNLRWDIMPISAYGALKLLFAT